MDETAAPEQVARYGVCVFAGDPGFRCRYGLPGPGNPFSCPDSAKLHAYKDHGVTFTEINRKGANAFTAEYAPGKLATRKLLEPSVDDLRALTETSQKAIQICSRWSTTRLQCKRWLCMQCYRIAGEWLDGTLLLGCMTRSIPYNCYLTSGFVGATIIHVAAMRPRLNSDPGYVVTERRLVGSA